MSDNIARKIRKLENQNSKFKRLLETTLQITSEETAKCLNLRKESSYLKRAVFELEGQKKQLEDELNMYLSDNPEFAGPKIRNLNNEDLDIKDILNTVLKDVERESQEVEGLKIDDKNLKEIIVNLNQEKEHLLKNIELIKHANEENNRLAEENLKLRQELASLQKDDTNETKLMLDIENDLTESKNVSKNPLNIPTENTILELKLSSLEKQKEKILNDLRTSLLLSANEISKLHCNTSDDQIKSVLNELEVHKTILMLNLGNLKDLKMSSDKGSAEEKIDTIDHCSLSCFKAEKCVLPPISENSEKYLTAKQIDLSQLSTSIERFNFDMNISGDKPMSISSFPSNSSEIIQKIIDIRDSKLSDYSLENISVDQLSTLDQDYHELPTVSEEEETVSEISNERDRLKTEIARLEDEKSVLIQQLEIYSVPNNRCVNLPKEKHEIMGEMSSVCIEMPVIQSAVNDEEQLEQRVKELEEDNRKIRGDLHVLLQEIQNDKEDNAVLERGEKLIKDNGGSIGDVLKTDSKQNVYPESRLAKLFNGSIPIVLDSLKQHYFIDRDGGMFRHILNFMRNSKLLIPENFQDLDLLLEEARYFDIPPMVRQLEQMKRDRIKNGNITLTTDLSTMSRTTSKPISTDRNVRSSSGDDVYECVALHVSPDLGERIMLSGNRNLLDDIFPETNQRVLDVRTGAAWNQQDAHHVIRFPLNGYCKLNSMQVIRRLLNAGFKIAASNGGGVEGQQFSEYLFVRKVLPG
ncbi:hypothetical protein GWI33_022336 [Rhynchophorus ferrugineus]|uniref:BTB domain-containing protein n=1 Tax=Rhynchophorus ferrugineus TaxID=354439 RepID=A0A834LYC5_RHYFE|nr:hypothetical protein GWI33_022336 [Rhynchophorus ferrugineus]